MDSEYRLGHLPPHVGVHSIRSILSSHLTGIALFAGAILVTDLRLLGVVLRNQPVADVVDQLRWPKRIGFLIVATCGFLLASSKAEEYYYNAFFRIKLTLFVLVAIHALVFRGSVYNNAAALDQAAGCRARQSWRLRSRCFCGSASLAWDAGSATSSRRSTSSTRR